MAYLDKINSPEDLKKLNTAEMEALAGEIRSAVLNRDSKIGGHVGPNLGIVETAIALHYVFDSPKDKIVYDVSHQSYPHKILTGRKNGFLKVEEMGKISGYTNPNESEHDFFVVGHTSTSVSLACGLAKARDLRGEKHNVIAVIGDGSLSGGEALIGVLGEVKDTPRPTVVHVHTLKGKGYKFAEENKERWHWNLPFDIKTGEVTVETGGESYNDITYDYLKNKIAEDKTVVAVNAGTPGAFGINAEKRAALGENFVDVGIAEEHAVAMSSALAKGGCKPVYLVWSSFIQRTYDQLSQDLAINNNPAVILVSGAGISGGDVTHLGCFDIPLIGNIPNIVYLAPAGKEEYLAMLDWAVEQTAHPVVIRIPSEVRPSVGEVEKDYGRLNRYQTVKRGEKVAVLGLGSFFALGQRVVERLRERGIEATLINPRYITGLDGELLTSLKADHQLVATLEDGELDGGFGEKIARFYGADPMKVLTFGAKKEFTDRVPLDELYRRYHLTPEQIADDIMKAL